MHQNVPARVKKYKESNFAKISQTEILAKNWTKITTTNPLRKNCDHKKFFGVLPSVSMSVNGKILCTSVAYDTIPRRSFDSRFFITNETVSFVKRNLSPVIEPD